MKKFLALFIVAVCSSCAFTNSVFERPLQPGVDFTRGRWLLNTLNVPPEADLTQTILKDFSGQLPGRFVYYPESEGLLLPQKVQMQPGREAILGIGKGTNYDYFINIKAGILKDDLGSVSFEQRATASPLNNSSYAELEIYDLKAGTVIYSQKVVSTAGRPGNEKGVMVSNASINLVRHAYKKLFKDLLTRSYTGK